VAFPDLHLSPIQMILAIESCHKLGFIHRDIKTDVSTGSGSIRSEPC
jgi:serine/threonine protein kinase